MAELQDIAMKVEDTLDVIRNLYLDGQTTAVNRSNAIHIMALPVENMHTTNNDAKIPRCAGFSRYMVPCVSQGRYVVKARKSDMAKFRIILSEAVRCLS
jgi:hypothetical protein